MPDILTLNQVAMLKVIGEEPSLAQAFYLTGGTPLAAFYLHHRYSEDLDFFSEEVTDLISLTAFFETLKGKLGFTSVEFHSTMNRNLYFLEYPVGSLKMEFTYFPFPRIEKGPTEFGLQIDSLLDIAVNKLFTITQRTKARDYIDLYMICQKEGYSIDRLVGLAKAKFDWHIDPVQLGTQFLRSSEAPDLPHMIAPVSSGEWQQFFTDEAKKLAVNLRKE